MAIAVFLAEGFEEIEALTVVDLARRAGIETRMVRVPAGEEHGEAASCCEGTDPCVTGSHGIRVCADEDLSETELSSFDMLVLPGGLPGTTNLASCDALTDAVKSFLDAGKKVATICAAPGIILGRKGWLKGRTAVSHPSVRSDLKDAQVPDADAVTDDNLITACGMGCAIPFALEIVKALCGEEKAEEIRQAIVYRAYQ